MAVWVAWDDSSEIAAVMMRERGRTTVWTNERLIATDGNRRQIEAWVRLSVLRGRAVAVWTASDMALCAPMPAVTADATQT